jgi:hypothetical protein
MTKLTPSERRLLNVIERHRKKKQALSDKPIRAAPTRSTEPEVLEPSEYTRRGGPSRIAAQVRRNLHRFRHLRRIVISQHAPAWRLKAQATDPAPRGLQSILIYDSEGYTDLWYKTATRGHRAKIFLR